jgi:hypothetical protein
MAKSRKSLPGNIDWKIPPALFLGLALLNAFLVSPYLGWYDSGEMVGATACLGISHPSGQVLFHLLGKVFLLLPWGTPAWRLGLMSVFCSALASVLFWVLACRLVAQTGGPVGKAPSPVLKIWLALLTLAWSLSQAWWVYSLTPLVYALHLLLGLLILWALSLDQPGKWFLAFFILGVSTIFRPTQFFALPFVGAAFLWAGWRNKKAFPKSLVFSIAFFALGRSTALYLPLRSALHPAIAYADLTHPLALVKHVLALKFSHSMGANSLQNVFHVAGMMLGRFWTDLTPFGIGLLAWGLALLYSKRKRIPPFLWIALGWGLLEAAFIFTIPFPTFEPHQVLLGWVYCGLLAALPLGFLEGKFRKGIVGRGVIHVLLGAFILAQLFSAGHLWDRRKEMGAQDYARNLLTIMGPGAVYLPAEENEYFPVAGYQQSFGFRKDVEVLEPGNDPLLIGPRIREALEGGRPLYVTRKWDLPPGWSYQLWGPLLRVVPAGMVENPGPAARGKPLAAWGGLELTGVEVDPPQVKAGGVLVVTYHWARRKASAEDASDLVVGLFIDLHGNYWMRNGIFWLHDIHEFPAGSLSSWKPSFLYQDQRIIFVPSDFPPGNYAIAVGLQKRESPREEGQEPFNREFYERNSYQDLDKFMGRGENDSVVQYSAGGRADWKGGLWPVTASLYPIADPRFVPAATVQILPAN